MQVLESIISIRENEESYKQKKHLIEEIVLVNSICFSYIPIKIHLLLLSLNIYIEVKSIFYLLKIVFLVMNHLQIYFIYSNNAKQVCIVWPFRTSIVHAYSHSSRFAFTCSVAKYSTRRYFFFSLYNLCLVVLSKGHAYKRISCSTKWTIVHCYNLFRG